jgi:hypothetical protein
MAFDQLKRTRGDFFFTRAWKYPSEHLISQRENGNQIGIAADSAFFEFFHELNNLLSNANKHAFFLFSSQAICSLFFRFLDFRKSHAPRRTRTSLPSHLYRKFPLA